MIGSLSENVANKKCIGSFSWKRYSTIGSKGSWRTLVLIKVQKQALVMAVFYKCRELLEQPSNPKVYKKDPAPCVSYMIR